MIMAIHHPDAIWLIPPLLAVSFLLWVLWNFWKDERKHRQSARAAQPHLLVSTRDWDRSSSRGQTWDPYPTGRAVSPTSSGSMERAARG